MRRSESSRRAEATATWQAEIDQRLREQFPDATDNESMVLKYADKELPFVSFRYKSTYQNALLMIAMQRAADETDEVTFATHGAAGHQVFPEATEELFQAIEAGSYNAEIQSLSTIVRMKGTRKEVPIHRLVVETPRFNRVSRHPVPYQRAKTMKGNEVTWLRKLAVDEGLAMAVLAGLYRRLNVDRLFEILGNPEFSRVQMHRKGPTLLRNHPNDEYWLRTLYEMLVLPVVSGVQKQPFTIDTYNQALDYMEKIEWLKKGMRSEMKRFGTVAVEQNPYARAILRGMTEHAQLQANVNYIDPARTEYIERKYGQNFTTQVITAFLVFD